MDYKQQIKEIGLTQNKVAELIGIHPVNLSVYIKGKTKSMPLHIEDKIKEVIKRYKAV